MAQVNGLPDGFTIVEDEKPHVDTSTLPDGFKIVEDEKPATRNVAVGTALAVAHGTGSYAYNKLVKPLVENPLYVAAEEAAAKVMGKKTAIQLAYDAAKAAPGVATNAAKATWNMGGRALTGLNQWIDANAPKAMGALGDTLGTAAGAGASGIADFMPLVMTAQQREQILKLMHKNTNET